ncbi:MAG: isoquinoline 1-oxidoreductase subunit alpha, partial [Bradyrhizobium sp.]|nr:isoquinoline 1-oxidoreductase subunit alpha [Bradyrhizobium sp.]
MANLTINGKAFELDVEPDTPLLWAIRENAGLTGTKYGCGIAQCGACTVHVDGVAMRSCGMLVSEAVGKQITTIEGLAANGALLKVQQAWIAKDVPQCGYCQWGMFMAASSNARGGVDRLAHLLEGAPAADVGDGLVDVLIGRLRLLLEQGRDRHDHSALAIAALRDVVIDPGLLHPVQRALR